MDKRLRWAQQSLWLLTKQTNPGGLLPNKYKYKYKYRGGLLSNGSLHSLIDNEIEAAVEEKKREKVRFVFIKLSLVFVSFFVTNFIFSEVVQQ